jgi:hypothetical protein
MGGIIGHKANDCTFDETGYAGSWKATYYYSNGTPIFGWGSYDYGQYLFANYDGRVGKQG